MQQLWDLLLSTLGWSGSVGMKLNYNNNTMEMLHIAGFEEFWVSVVSSLAQKSDLITQRGLVIVY